MPTYQDVYVEEGVPEPDQAVLDRHGEAVDKVLERTAKVLERKAVKCGLIPKGYTVRYSLQAVASVVKTDG